MRLLLDTHLLLWLAAEPLKLSAQARALIEEPDNVLIFSAVGFWEAAIKRALNRPDFRVDLRALRRRLLDNGYTEMLFSSEHALAVVDLPVIHGDPFDRALLAQAVVERVTLITADKTVGDYPGSIERV